MVVVRNNGSNHSFEGEKIKISVVGLGLIGGSLAAAFKQQPDIFEVTGYNRGHISVEQALNKGIIDKGAASIEEAAENADVIFICIPVGLIPEFAMRAAKSAKPGAIITDVGSTKATLVEQIEPNMPEGVHFIGGHPMAGSEKTGVGAANPNLYKNAHFLLTPTDKTELAAYQRLHSILSAIGANVIAVEPTKHDRAVAVISHLPHMVAATLMNLASRESGNTENLLLLAAGGFKDTTRVAAGSPEMWIDICLDNRDALLYSVEVMVDMLESLMHALHEEDKTKITEILVDARDARTNLPAALGKGIGKLYEIHIPVPDRPGVISDITLTVGQLGINIEDIEILHATDVAGTLRLAIPEKENAERAARALSEKGYDVDVRTQ